jgi:hypothetical protein
MPVAGTVVSSENWIVLQPSKRRVGAFIALLFLKRQVLSEKQAYNKKNDNKVALPARRNVELLSKNTYKGCLLKKYLSTYTIIWKDQRNYYTTKCVEFYYW